MGTSGVVSIGDPNGQNTTSGHPDAFTRQLTGLAAGIEDYDAVNVAQLKALDSITVRYTSADAKNEIILGDGGNTASINKLTAKDLDGIDENKNYAATTGQVYNVGKGTVDALGGGFALGADGTITGDFKYRSTAGLNTVQSVFDTISGDVTANETNIESLGQETASALGGNSSYTAGTLTTKLTVGDVEYSTVQDALSAVDDMAVKYDNGKDSVTLGGADDAPSVTLKNVAAGADGTDAVNVSQLNDALGILGNSTAVNGQDGTITKNGFAYRSNTGLNTVQEVFNAVSGDVTANETNIESLGQETASALGGNSTYKDGTLTTKLTVGDVEYTSVQEALSAVDDMAVKYDNGQNSVTLGGADDAPSVTLKNVAAGAAGTDAVNVSQLNDALGILGNGAEVNDTNGSIMNSGFAYRSNTGLNTVQEVFNAVSGDVTANQTKIDAIGDVLGTGYNNPEFVSATIGGMEMNNSGINMKDKKITGLASGTTTNDAVNFGQLESLGNSAAAVLGEKSSFLNGQLTGSFTVNGETFDTVQEALEKLETVAASGSGSGTGSGTGTGTGSWTLSVNGKETNIGNGGNFAIADGSNVAIIKNDTGVYELNVVQNPEFASVKVGSINVREDGLDMGGKTIANVAAGKNNTDAVNMGQLTAVSTDLSDRIDSIAAGAPQDVPVVKYDEGTNKGVVSLNKGGDSVKLTNVKAGTDNLDAVNVAQLNEAKLSIETVSNDVATKYDGLDKKITENSGLIANNKAAIDLLNKSIETVSGDIGGLTGSISDFESRIGQSEDDIKGHNDRISDLEVSDTYSVKYDATKSEIVLGGANTRAAGDPVLISNLKGGEISQGSNQAVTGGQLFGLGDSIRQAFGGNSMKFEDGKLTGKLTIGGNNYSSVQAALTGLTTGAGTVVSGDIGWVLTVDGDSKPINAGTEFAIASGNNIDIAEDGNNGYVFNLKDDITVNSVTLNNAAEITAGGKEAFTVGQLHSLGESAANILGGNFSLANGKLDGSFTVNGTEYKTVQDALDAAAASGSGSGSGTGTGSWTLSVNGEETNIGDGGKFALASGSNVEINKNDAGAYELGVVKNPEFESIKVGNINIREEGINMGGNTITGLANGGIYQGSSDAVTGDQLWNAYRRIDTIDERVQVVGAHAAALSALHPVPYNPYEPTTFSAGFGMYRNEQSVAVGVFHYVRENVLVNAGLSLNSDGDTMGRAGISFAIGKSGRKQPSMVKDVASMQQQMAAMQQMLVELQKKDEEKDEMLRKNEQTIQELKEALEKKK
ncbi:YadA-like family protein [Cloacibacillus porcorum]